MEPRIEPTPETRAKLRPDIVYALFDDGEIQREHMDAAHEIREIWEAWGRALFPRPAEDGIRHRKTVYPMPLDLFTPAERTKYESTYKPWANEMGSEVAAGVVRVTRLQLTLDVVVDNHPLLQIESWYRLRQGNGLVYLKASLDRYARIAGWL